MSVISRARVNGNGKLIARTLVSGLSSKIFALPQITHFPPEGTLSRKFDVYPVKIFRAFYRKALRHPFTLKLCLIQERVSMLKQNLNMRRGN